MQFFFIFAEIKKNHHIMSKNIKNSFLYKAVVLLFLIINVYNVKAQMNCEISITEGVTMPVCYGESITLSVNTNPVYIYQWSKDGVDISGENSF